MIRVVIETVPPAEPYLTHSTYLLVETVSGAPVAMLDTGRVQERNRPDSPVWAAPPEWCMADFMVEFGDALREALAADAALSEDERERRWRRHEGGVRG